MRCLEFIIIPYSLDFTEPRKIGIIRRNSDKLKKSEKLGSRIIRKVNFLLKSEYFQQFFGFFS